MAPLNVDGCEPLSDAVAPVSKRTLANRRNALKSTGPRTEEGKAISRRNAMKHGLAGNGVVLPQQVEQQARERTHAWIASYRPTSSGDRDLIEMAAITLTRLHHCWREETMTRSNLIDRADQLWDLDREAEVAKLAARLSTKPMEISAELKRRAHGAAWMLEQWEDLAQRLEAGITWDESARTHALDLLGVGACFRDALSPVDRLDAAENPEALRLQRLEVARQQIAALGETIDHYLIPIDEGERELRCANQFTLTDPCIGLFLRYERMLSSRVLTILSRVRNGGKRSSNGTEHSPHQTNPSLLYATNDPTETDFRMSPPSGVTPVVNKASFYEIGRDAASREVELKASTTTAFTKTDLPRPADSCEVPACLPPEFANLPLSQLAAASLKIDRSDREKVEAMVDYMKRRVTQVTGIQQR